MFQVGNFVSFHGIHDEFEYVNDIERFIDDTSFYEVLEILDDILIVKSLSMGRDIPVDINEYQIHTKESLRQLLKSNKHQYAAICNKIRQLYRKQEFQFKGI